VVDRARSGPEPLLVAALIMIYRVSVYLVQLVAYSTLFWLGCRHAGVEFLSPLDAPWLWSAVAIAPLVPWWWVSWDGISDAAVVDG
jgi:hypothetical protein